MALLNLIFFIIACLFLAGGGYLTVRSLTKLTTYYKLKEFVVGFIIMAIATSIPEFFVGISSVLSSIPSLSFGDILGSNIVDLTVVIGIVAILSKGIRIDSEIRKDIFYTWVIAILPLILFIDFQLSRIDGLILLSAFSLYVFRLIKHRKSSLRYTNFIRSREIYKEFIIFIISIAILLVSAYYIVSFASFLILKFSLPAMLIGLVVVSIGTSLPELSFELNSVKKGYNKMALGDLFGSVAINSTLILGFVSLFSPIKANFPVFFVGASTLLLTLVFLIIFTKRGKIINKEEGVVLFVIYLIFLMFCMAAGIQP